MAKIWQLLSRLLQLIFVAMLAAHLAQAQFAAPAQQPTLTAPPAAVNLSSDESLTLAPHSESARWWVSGQANIILQWHSSFPAKYNGKNSLSSRAENATSRLFTLYTGLELTHTTEILVNFESAGGHGISDALGLADFTNLDVVRNPSLGANPYLARFILRQVIPLSHDTISVSRGPFGLLHSLPARRIEIRAGKFSLVDFFDANSPGSDSHLQFLGWTVDNNGAYDYAANTRGYTDGLVIEYDDRRWSLRFGEALMPKVANGINLDANLTRARSENAEAEFRANLLGALRPGLSGVIRLLSYVNHADMGSYREAINAFLSGHDSVLDVTRHRQQGRIKYGFGVNFEQELTARARVFGRFGWNEGHNESFAYTEVDQAIELGGDYKGNLWHRRNDRIGGAFSLNAISGDHRQYLALGGLGFLLGDGKLTYGRERVFEGYYTLHVWRGIFTSLDLQRITNPGYNQDRGPVFVPGLRLHVDF
jgi:high affinity Mn2+ porin